MGSILIFEILGKIAAEKLGEHMTSSGFGNNILGMLYGSGATGNMQWNLPLWFIPCLFVTLLIFYPIEAMLRKKKTLSPVVLSFFLVLSFLNFYVLKKKTLPFGLETAIYLIPFFVLGYLAKNFRSRKSLC